MFEEIKSNDIYTKLSSENIYQFTEKDKEIIKHTLSQYSSTQYKYNNAYIHYSNDIRNPGIRLQDDEMTLELPQSCTIHYVDKSIFINRNFLLEIENEFKILSYTLTVDFITENGRKAVLHINKGHDEWFYVEYPRIRKSYQCDQLDGLISFLNSVINHNI